MGSMLGGVPAALTASILQDRYNLISKPKKSKTTTKTASKFLEHNKNLLLMNLGARPDNEIRNLVPVAGTIAGTALGTMYGDKNLRSAGYSALGALAGGQIGMNLGAAGLGAWMAYRDNKKKNILEGLALTAAIPMLNTVGQLAGGIAAGHYTKKEASVPLLLDPQSYRDNAATLAGTALGGAIGAYMYDPELIPVLGGAALGGVTGKAIDYLRLEGIPKARRMWRNHKGEIVGKAAGTVAGGIAPAGMLYTDKLENAGAAVGKHFDKRASAQYRPRGTLILMNDKGQVYAGKAKRPDYSPYYFPGGGIFEGEGVDRLPTNKEVEEGMRREALEEIGYKLKNFRRLANMRRTFSKEWQDKTEQKRGVRYLGENEYYATANLGNKDNKLYGSEGDAFPGKWYDPRVVATALEAASPESDWYRSNLDEAAMIRRLIADIKK